ncbi:MAG: SCO family protein [Acetobacteraceae bacterium]
MTRGFLPLLALVIAAGTTTLGWGTDGFRVVTTEGARRLAFERHAPAVPEITLIDQDGVRFSPGSYRGKVVLVDFIYTSCPTICGLLGAGFSGVLDVLQREGADARQIDLLSVSFDQARDGPAELKAYGDRFGARSPRWRIAVPATEAGLRMLLRTFGVVVIPDAFGGFTHNGAFFLIDRDGRIVRILDASLPAVAVVRAARSVS